MKRQASRAQAVADLVLEQDGLPGVAQVCGDALVRGQGDALQGGGVDGAVETLHAHPQGPHHHSTLERPPRDSIKRCLSCVEEHGYAVR